MRHDGKVVPLFGQCRVLSKPGERVPTPSDWVNLADPFVGFSRSSRSADARRGDEGQSAGPQLAPRYWVKGDKLIILDLSHGSTPAAWHRSGDWRGNAKNVRRVARSKD